jgi:cyclase
MTVAVRIIPCLDIRAGRVVKGVNFENIIDAGDPVETAERYNAEGADELCFLDIDASYENRSATLSTVEAVASQVFIPLTVGGGVSKLQDIERLLEKGADKVSINTSAILDPSLVGNAAKKFGSQCIVVAVDSKREGEKSYVYTHGGKNKTAFETSAWIKIVEGEGAGEILLTSMDRDGTKIGFDNELTSSIAKDLSIPLITSGGAGSIDHMIEGITDGKADAVLAASIFHQKEITIGEVKDGLASKGIEVRL